MNPPEPSGNPYDPQSWAGSPYAPSHGNPYYGEPYDEQSPGSSHASGPGDRPSDPPPGSPFGPTQVEPASGPGKRRRRLGVAIGAAAVAAAAVLGFSLAGGVATVNGTPVAAQESPSTGSTGNGTGSSGKGTGNPGNGSGTGTTSPGSGTGRSGNGSAPNPGTGNGGGTSTTAGTASAKQQIGVVDIYTTLGYQGASAAGTGMVIDSSGYVLTNNHVIDDSTTVRVVIVSTGKTYTASVVGTAPTEDVAVVKLKNASGLTVANIGNSDSIKVGDTVTGVGNAGGAGGTPSAATGKITSLNETITASDETGTNAERLRGIIATDAPIKAGDSGGPLYNSADEIIGMDTAASTSGQAAGFAIPIKNALSVANQIRKGVETSVIHIGYPAFLGVTVSPQSTNGAGALIGNSINGLPAAKAGIGAGDVVTKVGSTAVANSTQLRAAIAKLAPGDKVALSYTDQAGASHRATVTLVAGPAD